MMSPAKTHDDGFIQMDVTRRIRSFKASVLITGVLVSLSLMLHAVRPDFAVAFSFPTVTAVVILTTFAVFCYLFSFEILTMFGSYQFGLTASATALFLVWNHWPAVTWFAMLLGIATLSILCNRTGSRR